MQLGLIMVVGFSGIGKTDVVVQIILNIYYNFFDQRIFIVIYFNQVKYIYILCSLIFFDVFVFVVYNGFIF